MKKIFISLAALLVLVGCGTSGTKESRYEAAVESWNDDKLALKMNISSIYDNTEVRYVYDNMGNILLDDEIQAKVKVSLDHKYTDVEITASENNYTVENGETLTVTEQEYIDAVGAALYGQFRSLLSKEVSELEETETDEGFVSSFTLVNGEDVLNILATNELHNLDVKEAVGNGTLSYDKKGMLTGGTLFVEFSGDLEESTFTGSVKLEFTVIDANSFN